MNGGEARWRELEAEQLPDSYGHNALPSLSADDAPNLRGFK